MNSSLSTGSSRRTAALVLMLLFLATSIAAIGAGTFYSADAQAHFKFYNGRWVFRGMTITADGDRHNRKDPISVLFKGGNHEYSNDHVKDRVSSWVGWGGSGFCSDKQRVVWTRPKTRNTTSDKDDWQLDNRGADECLGQRWHIRGWDDQEHRLYTDGHAGTNEWNVTGIHHESPSFKSSPGGATYTHTPDLDWDVVRREFVEAMKHGEHGHCAWPKWKRHPGARGNHQGFFNSGWIGRVSLERQPNC